MVLIDSAQARFGFLQCGFENVVENPALLIPEQRFKGISSATKVRVQHSDHSRNVCPRKRTVQLLAQGTDLKGDLARWFSDLEDATQQALEKRGEATAQELTSDLPALMDRLDDGRRVEQAYLITFGRLPSKKMADEALEFLRQGQEKEGLTAQQAWARFCQALFGANEFRYVD